MFFLCLFLTKLLCSYDSAVIVGLTLKIKSMNSEAYYIGREKGARGENAKVIMILMNYLLRRPEAKGAPAKLYTKVDQGCKCIELEVIHLFLSFSWPSYRGNYPVLLKTFFITCDISTCLHSFLHYNKGQLLMKCIVRIYPYSYVV